MHGFIKENRDKNLAKRIQDFFNHDEYKKYQHKYLQDTEYLPEEKLYVDFDFYLRPFPYNMLENPDFTEDTIGSGYLEFADLITELDAKLEDNACYAHLAIHAKSTKVYLMEPSGDPELIANTLDDFLTLLNSP